jgi:hypothetical protein
MKIPSLQGKTLHESLFDPRLFHMQVKKQVNLVAKQDFSGAVPGLFVGHHGFPHVRIGLLSTEQYREHDNPLAWVRQKTSLQDIVSLRSELVNAGVLAHVKLPNKQFAERIKEVAREAAMAIKPLDVDLSLDKKPLFRLSMEDDVMPHGPKASLTGAQVTSNPKIPAVIDKVVADTDLRAGSGLGLLWRRGFSEHQLAHLLAAGTLGSGLQRHLVPTRWSITAVDDTVGKQVHASIMDCAEVDCSAYFGGYQGNYFLVLFFPQAWSFELFENAIGDAPASLSLEYHDFECFRGRSTYAEHTAGGYYAARLAVLEHLQGLKRKGGVLVLRFITKEYWAPLGVWVVREAVRAALKEKPLVFGDADLLLRYAQVFVQRKFGADVTPLLTASLLLAERRSQTTLARFC